MQMLLRLVKYREFFFHKKKIVPMGVHNIFYPMDATDKRSNLMAHMRTKPFALCPYTASRQQHLVNHMRTHTGEKPFACAMCPYAAAERKTLVAHMRTHSGEKPFACALCQYATALKSNLHANTLRGEAVCLCFVPVYHSVQVIPDDTHAYAHWGEAVCVCFVPLCRLSTECTSCAYA